MEIINEFDSEKAKEIASKKNYFDSGKRGVVYRSGPYLLKYKKLDSTAQNTIRNEAYFNYVLNKEGLAPKFYFLDLDGRFLIREFIEGKQLRKYLDEVGGKNRGELRNLVKSLLLKARKFDVLGINKTEWTNPYKDVIVNDDGVVLIDFERCRWSENPQNVNQLLQFFMRSDLEGLFQRIGVNLCMRKIVLLGRKYKKNYEEERFEDIMSFFSFS